MKIVIAGGTGLIGRHLRAACAAAGHESILLSRRERDARSQPPTTALWDGTSPGPWQGALEGADAVVNLCGESVAQGRWTASRKKALVDSRIGPTRALVSAVSAAKRRPRVFVSASAVGYYGDRGDEPLDEGAKPGSDFLAGLCEAWEREARLIEPLGVRVVCLRIGVVLAPDGGALAKMLPIFRLGLGGRLGGGRQWMSWIAISDLTDLMLFALSHEITGPLNATAPNPVANRDFTAALGRSLGRPALLPAPGLALRLALGEMAQLLLGGQKVLPRKALESGFAFKHPQVDAALRAALR